MLKVFTLVSMIISFQSFATSIVQRYTPECDKRSGVSVNSSEKVIAAKGFQGTGTGKDFCVSKEEINACSQNPKEACSYSRKEEMKCNGVASNYQIDCDSQFKDCCVTPIEPVKPINKNFKGRM